MSYETENGAHVVGKLTLDSLRNQNYEEDEEFLGWACSVDLEGSTFTAICEIRAFRPFKAAAWWLWEEE